MRGKFGRRLRNESGYGYSFDTDFEVESYLRYRGSSFTKRFDANSFLYLSKAMDYFDLSHGLSSLAEAFRNGFQVRGGVVGGCADLPARDALAVAIGIGSDKVLPE